MARREYTLLQYLTKSNEKDEIILQVSGMKYLGNAQQRSTHPRPHASQHILCILPSHTHTPPPYSSHPAHPIRACPAHRAHHDRFKLVICVMCEHNRGNLCLFLYLYLCWYRLTGFRSCDLSPDAAPESTVPRVPRGFLDWSSARWTSVGAPFGWKDCVRYAEGYRAEVSSEGRDVGRRLEGMVDRKRSEGWSGTGRLRGEMVL